LTLHTMTHCQTARSKSQLFVCIMLLRSLLGSYPFPQHLCLDPLMSPAGCDGARVHPGLRPVSSQFGSTSSTSSGSVSVWAETPPPGNTPSHPNSAEIASPSSAPHTENESNGVGGCETGRIEVDPHDIGNETGAQPTWRLIPVTTWRSAGIRANSSGSRALKSAD
jgi:hypothetical protein